MKLHTKILLGLALGGACGVAVNLWAADTATIRWIEHNVAVPAGQIFLRLLLMTVVPLVFTSITLGVAGMGDLSRVGRIGGKTLAYFVASTGLAVLLGLTLVNVVRPGEGLDPATREQMLTTYVQKAPGSVAAGPAEFGVGTFVNIVPRNPIQAAANTEMLAVIFVALVFGAALTTIPAARARLVLEPLEVIGDVIIKVIELAMKLAPYGVFALIFVATSRFGLALIASLSTYVVVVLVALAAHAFITLSVLVRVFGGLSPAVFWRRVRAVAVTAFSTSSSAATLPTTIAVAERSLGIPPSVAGFVLPLGATMNMNGTSLFEGITVLFLAQVFGVELNLGQQVVVVLLSVITAIGAAGVPGGSLPLLMLVLATVGVPPEGIAIILGVDRLLDMARTTLNVCGDVTAAVVVARSEGVWTAQEVPPEQY